MEKNDTRCGAAPRPSTASRIPTAVLVINGNCRGLPEKLPPRYLSEGLRYSCVGEVAVGHTEAWGSSFTIEAGCSSGRCVAMVRPYLPAQDSGQGQREEAERWILVGFHLLRGGCS